MDMSISDMDLLQELFKSFKNDVLNKIGDIKQDIAELKKDTSDNTIKIVELQTHLQYMKDGFTETKNVIRQEFLDLKDELGKEKYEGEEKNELKLDNAILKSKYSLTISIITFIGSIFYALAYKIFSK
jgi:hypothetical protein